jgi:hypothetical protein
MGSPLFFIQEEYKMKFDLEEHFFDENDNSVIIKAGTEGWQILYADGSDKTVEKKATAQENLDEAYKYAIKNEKIVIPDVIDEEE